MSFQVNREYKIRWNKNIKLDNYLFGSKSFITRKKNQIEMIEIIDFVENDLSILDIRFDDDSISYNVPVELFEIL